MQAWRALGRLVVVATIFGVCFVLLMRVIGPGSPWLGLLLMFYFMGLARVAEPLFRLRLPRGLQTVAPSRANDRDRRLGIHRFGALLRQTPLRRLNDSVYRANGARSLAALRIQLASSEAIHFWAAILFSPYIVYVGVRGHVVEAATFVVVQVVVNVYPILHLRLVRARLDRADAAAMRKRQGAIRQTSRFPRPARTDPS